MSKVYQESGLRDVSNIALVKPGDQERRWECRINGHDNGETPAGSIQVLIRYDSSVMPECLARGSGTRRGIDQCRKHRRTIGILSLCLAEDGRSWRVASAKVSKRTV